MKGLNDMKKKKKRCVVLTKLYQNINTLSSCLAS